MFFHGIYENFLATHTHMKTSELFSILLLPCFGWNEMNEWISPPENNTIVILKLSLIMVMVIFSHFLMMMKNFLSHRHIIHSFIMIFFRFLRKMDFNEWKLSETKKNNFPWLFLLLLFHVFFLVKNQKKSLIKRCHNHHHHHHHHLQKWACCALWAG